MCLGGLERTFTTVQVHQQLDPAATEHRLVQETYLVLFARCLLASNLVPEACLEGQNPFPCLEKYLHDRGAIVPTPAWYTWGQSVRTRGADSCQELQGVTLEAGDLFFRIIPKSIVALGSACPWRVLYSPGSGPRDGARCIYSRYGNTRPCVWVRHLSC